MTIANESAPVTRAPWARQRILDTASRLFREEGIMRTGVDRVIAEAGTTKSTFYKYYPKKANLVMAYLAAAHDRDVARFEELTREEPDPACAIERISELIAQQIRESDFRGCQYLNAASESPDPSDGVRAAVQEHRDWYIAAMAELFGRLGHPLPGDAADEFMIARDGAMAASLAGDVPGATAAMKRVAARLIADARRAA